MARNAAEEEVVAVSAYINGVIAGGEGCNRGWCIAWLVHGMRHSHHIVEFVIVFKYYKYKLPTISEFQLCSYVGTNHHN